MFLGPEPDELGAEEAACIPAGGISVTVRGGWEDFWEGLSSFFFQTDQFSLSERWRPSLESTERTMLDSIGSDASVGGHSVRVSENVQS